MRIHRLHTHSISFIYKSRELGLKIILAIHALYLASDGLLYMIIQIDYQNRRKSPFETHMVMKSSLVALCVYFCAAALHIKLVQTNNELDIRRLLKHVLVCSGILSPLSNALVFFPNMVGCIVVLLFVFATTILLTYDVFKLISNRIFEGNNINNDAAPTSGPEASEMNTGINHNAATTSGPVASEMNTGISHNAATATSESTNMSTGISHNAATTFESTEMSTGISHNAATTTYESTEMSTGINNNESSKNTNDAV